MRTAKKSFLYMMSAALGLALCPLAAAEVHEETREHRFAASEVTTIAILNLAGAVKLTGTDGDELIVKAMLSGEADDAEEARRNAGLLSLDIRRDGEHVEIVTVYPVKEYDEYIYYRGEDDGGFFGWGSSTTTSYMGERVSVRSGGDGIGAHVDYELQIPEGMTVTFENKVGTIHAENVNGKLRLDTSSGAIAISGGKGDVNADTGSGEIEVTDRNGDVFADTGSGGVTVRKVTGDVEADTGSGGVDVTEVTGDVFIDTGSGGADLERVTGSIHVDTGSGGVDGRDLKNVRELEIDTGSGSVELDGDFSALERMMIDTGSGGVRMQTTGTLNMHLTVSAGSGGVRVDLPEMSNVRTGRGEFEAKIGNGEGRGVIDTGSGGVRITSE
ncbi:MAG TPA: DUF4097 family beta strand repeat-containing protein [Gammaproteobacteria bacterium]